jgi:hypothetical protein
VPKLKTQRTETGWEVVNPGDTIQFLRSRLWPGDVLCEGRIAIATNGGAAEVEKRYKKLCAFVRRNFRNNVVGWTNYSMAPTANVRPDPSAWIGPGALRWLQGGGGRTFKQSFHSRSHAVLCGNGGKEP